MVSCVTLTAMLKDFQFFFFGGGQPQYCTHTFILLTPSSITYCLLYRVKILHFQYCTFFQSWARDNFLASRQATTRQHVRASVTKHVWKMLMPRCLKRVAAMNLRQPKYNKHPLFFGLKIWSQLSRQCCRVTSSAFFYIILLHMYCRFLYPTILCHTSSQSLDIKKSRTHVPYELNLNTN